jgi:hypothetical protein
VRDALQQTASASSLPAELGQVLTGMAADLKGLRLTMEVMTEQVGKLVAFGGQQIEAIERVAPLVFQSFEGIAVELQEVVNTIQPILGSSALVSEPARTEEMLTRRVEPVEPMNTAFKAELAVSSDQVVPARA